VTDDAAIVAYRACQLEVWHGERSSWLQPACQPIPALELTVGIGSLDHGAGREAELLLQVGYMPRQVEPGRAGFGIVAGVGYDPQAQAGSGVEGIFAYVPVSYQSPGGALLLHVNLGWHHHAAAGHDGHHHTAYAQQHGAHSFVASATRADVAPPNALERFLLNSSVTWATRTDVALPGAFERFMLIGEVFGEDRLVPGYQIAVRTALVADRLEADISWGGHTDRRLRGTGWTVGLAWTPPPFY
jgi:hypothetical protein